MPNLNPICHLLALGAHHILHVGRIRGKTWNGTYINSANVSHTKQFIPTMLHRLSFSLWRNFTFTQIPNKSQQFPSIPPQNEEDILANLQLS